MSCLLDPHMPVFMPAGSTTHAHARTRWIPPAHPCSCLMDPRTPVSVPDGSTHARTHALGPHVCLLAGSHTRWLTGSPHALARRVSIHAHTGPMHARLHQVPMPAHLWGPHTCWLAGSPHALACRVPKHTRSRDLHTACTGPMHAHSHQVPMRICTQGPHVRSLTGSPYMHAPGPCTRAHSQGLHAHVYVSTGCIMCASLSCMHWEGYM